MTEDKNKGLPWEVASNLPGMDDIDRQRRLLAMVYRRGSFDLDGRYTDRMNNPHRLARVHLTTDHHEDAGYAATDIDGIDDITFGEDVRIYLEDRNGTLTGYNDARGILQSEWMYGVIFRNDDAGTWAFGRSDPGSGDICENEPILMEISTDFFESLNFGFEGESPLEGEIYLVYDKPPRLVEIPWSSDFAAPVEEGDTWPNRTENRLREQAVLEAVKERIRSMDAEHAPSM